MNTENIISLMEAFDSSSLSFLEVDENDIHLKMKKRPAVDMSCITASDTQASFANTVMPTEEMPVSNIATAKNSENVNEATTEESIEDTKSNILRVASPMVGVFYAAPAPDQPPYVTVGTHVNEGETVCLIEAMKLFNEVPSPCNGTVVAIHAQNANVLGFDELIMEIEVDE